MPRYDFRCPKCDNADEVIAPIAARPEHHLCLECGHYMNRVFSFASLPSYNGGFNPTTGTYTRNTSDLTSQLSKLSDERTERTGMLHKFVPCDLRDKEAFGVTSDDQ